MRLFIGISFPDPMNLALSKLRGSLPFVQWNPPESYHLTLCFIGEVKNSHLITDLDLALEKIRVPAFELTVQNVGVFSLSNHQQILWAGVLLCPELYLLRKKIEQVLRNLNIIFPRKRFYPHITLARSSNIAEEKLAIWVQSYNLLNLPPVKILQFSLFSSYPGKDGPHYVSEANYFLS